MFYIENEEEHARAVSLLERLLDTYKTPTSGIQELQKAIIEWEDKEEDTPVEDEIVLANSD